jgi:hypothetical protein
MKHPALYLTRAQVQEVVRVLEGVAVPQRTMADWLASGLIVASVQWVRRPGRGGARRNHPVLFNLTDLARIRLVVRLRQAGFPPSQVRMILGYIDADLREALKPKSKAKIAIMDGRVFIVPAGSSVPVEATAPGQAVLFSASELLQGNEEAAVRVGAMKVA